MKALGPTQNKTAQLKSICGKVITDKGETNEVMGRALLKALLQREQCCWLGVGCHWTSTYHGGLRRRTNTGRTQLGLDSLACGKAPGTDGVLPDLIKRCKSTLLQPLHDTLCQCWHEGAVPQDMKDDKIVNLHKNKGDRSDCNNYRGISLLSIVGVVNVHKTIILIGFFNLICPILTQQSQLYRKTYSCRNFERDWSRSNVHSLKRSTCQSNKTIQTKEILSIFFQVSFPEACHVFYFAFNSAQSVRSCRARTPPATGWTGLSWIPMRFPRRTLNSGHDFLPSITPGEMQVWRYVMCHVM